MTSSAITRTHPRTFRRVGAPQVVFTRTRRSFGDMRNTLLVMLLSASVAGAQGGATGGSITGSVVDDHGAPVRDADVFAPPSTARARTDSVGHFVLSNLSADFYHVRVRHIGFTAAEITVHDLIARMQQVAETGAIGAGASA